MILLLKLVITPFFIAVVTLAGRRWGPTISGLLMGLPLTSGPVSFFLALQYGPAFAGRAAVGTLVGQASVCLYCLGYSAAARRSSWPLSALAAVCVFLLATALWNSLTWSVATASAVLLAVILLVSRLIPRQAVRPAAGQAPRWDLPARMILAAAFVVALTTFANSLGPQLSGLLSPFPVFGLILSVFTHHQQGTGAVRGLLRAVVLGSLAFGGFFAVVGSAVTSWALPWTYALATLAALAMGGLSFYLTRTAGAPRLGGAAVHGAGRD
jgi:uncharacterized membrane protein